jgi:hypothetical protein
MKAAESENQSQYTNDGRCGVELLNQSGEGIANFSVGLAEVMVRNKSYNIFSSYVSYLKGFLIHLF